MILPVSDGLFVTAFDSLKACPRILQSAFTSSTRVKTDVITLSKVEVSAALGEKESETRGGGIPLTGWQPTGPWAYLSLAGGLSAGPVNLPDRSLQVPLIPLIQFILLTAQMWFLSLRSKDQTFAPFSAALVGDGTSTLLSLTSGWKVWRSLGGSQIIPLNVICCTLSLAFVSARCLFASCAVSHPDASERTLTINTVVLLLALLFLHNSCFFQIHYQRSVT